jgi:hypothetical protein
MSSSTLTQADRVDPAFLDSTWIRTVFDEELNVW